MPITIFTNRGRRTPERRAAALTDLIRVMSAHRRLEKNVAVIEEGMRARYFRRRGLQRNIPVLQEPGRSEAVNLREHPLMQWPPIWSQASRAGKKIVVGEFGLLRHIHRFNGDPNKIYLVIDYEAETFIGALEFGDGDFCDRIARLLQGKIGHSIREIGDLNLSADP